MELSIRAPICDTSYGLVSLNIIKALTEGGHRISVFPIGGIDGNSIPTHFHDSLRAGLECSQTWNVDAPCVTIFHQFALAESTSRRRVAFPIFELDQFNERELHHLRSVDQLLVPSFWAKEVCLKAGLTQHIDIVPLGVDTGRIFPQHYGKTDTVFVTTGKQELRKYHDGLIKCFEKAFSEADNVELWMLWGNRLISDIQRKEWNDYYLKSSLSGKVKLFDWIPHHGDVLLKMQSADCFIGISRAEGWNLGLLEAMAMGLPVITNYYSGHSEYVTDMNALVVPFRKKETAYDGVWFHGQGQWMALEKPEEDYIVRYMQQIHQKKQNGDNLFNRYGVETAERFTWVNTAERLVAALQ